MPPSFLGYGEKIKTYIIAEVYGRVVRAGDTGACSGACANRKSASTIEITDASLNVISLGPSPIPPRNWAAEEAILVGRCAGFESQILGVSSDLGLDVRVESLQLSPDLLLRVSKR